MKKTILIAFLAFLFASCGNRTESPVEVQTDTFYWVFEDEVLSMYHAEAMNLNGSNCHVMSFDFDKVIDVCCKYKDNSSIIWVEYYDSILCDKSLIYNEFIILHADEATIAELLDASLFIQSNDLDSCDKFKLNNFFRIYWDEHIDCYRLVYVNPIMEGWCNW